MKKQHNLIISVLAVVAIIISVGGGTYAYFTWVTSEEQQTSVEFTVDADALGGTLYANIVGNANVSSNDATLKPTTCTNSANAIIKTIPITYMNSSVQAATVTASLKVTAFNLRSTSHVPTSANLGYLKYALTEDPTSCTTSPAQSGSFSAIRFSSGVASNLPVTLFSQTITAPASMTEEDTKTYYLWIWLDSGYTHENVGNVNDDPMQGFSITAEWSGTISQNNS